MLIYNCQKERNRLNKGEKKNMLSYKQIKRENHIIETLTVEHEKFELYENNDFGDYVFFILVNVTKGWYVLTREDIRHAIDNLYCVKPLLIN